MYVNGYVLPHPEFVTEPPNVPVSDDFTQKDNVTVLRKYAKEKKVNSKRWKLLTGEKNEIYNLGRKYYFVEEDEGVKKGNDVVVFMPDINKEVNSKIFYTSKVINPNITSLDSQHISKIFIESVSIKPNTCSDAYTYFT